MSWRNESTSTAIVAVSLLTNTSSGRWPSSEIKAKAIRQQGQVGDFTDGDTIDVVISAHEYCMHYMLIDTPERGMPYYSDAREANWRLLPNRDVCFEMDISETDRYDRLLHYVYPKDGTFVNRELVAKDRHNWSPCRLLSPKWTRYGLRSKRQWLRAVGSEAASEWSPAAAPSGSVVVQNANLRAG